MTDDAETIAKKIRKAKTDPDGLPSEVAGLEDRPEARNLVNIYAALADSSIETAILSLVALVCKVGEREARAQYSGICEPCTGNM